MEPRFLLIGSQMYAIKASITRYFPSDYYRKIVVVFDYKSA